MSVKTLSCFCFCMGFMSLSVCVCVPVRTCGHPVNGFGDVTELPNTTTHKVDNLLKPESYRKWKCAENAERHASVILQFEKASQIHSIDVGNESSAFVEVLVGHSTSTALDDYQVILVTSSFMSPMESKNGTNTNRVRMFGPDKLSKAVMDKKWDRVKVVCSQPFNKFISYGLSFIKFHSPPTEEDESSTAASPQSQATSRLGKFKLKEDPKTASITPGAFFKQRSITKADPAPLTGAAAVRAAATLAATSLTASATTSQAATASVAPSQTQQKPPKTIPSTAPHKQSDTRTEASQKATQKRRLSDEDVAPPKRVDTKVAAARRDDADREEGRSKAPPPKKSREESSRQTTKSKSFERQMEGVTFVLSGFQNPLRGDLREKALEMGAKYRPDWGSGCTHLVCAFANTPKFNQVKNKGKIVTKAWILDSYKKKSVQPWLRYSMLSDSDESSSYEEESETDEEDDWEPTKRRKPSPQKATPTKAMPKNATPKNATPKKATPKKATPKKATTRDAEDGDGVGQGASGSPQQAKPSEPDAKEDDDCSTTDIDSDAGEVTRTASSRQQDEMSSGGDTEDELRRIQEKGCEGKVTAKDNYDSSTDEEVDIPTAGKPESAAPSLPDIPDLPDFFTNKIFFLYGKFDAEERRQITRLIVTFDGTVEDYMTDEVSYVITNAHWDENFDKALSEHPGLSFVRPKWIYACSEKSKLVPYQPYVVVPS